MASRGSEARALASVVFPEPATPHNRMQAGLSRGFRRIARTSCGNSSVESTYGRHILKCAAGGIEKLDSPDGWLGGNHL